jgi:hypothetical protein
MNPITTALEALFNRIPRRHTTENVKDIYSIITEYEDILIKIEGTNAYYEKRMPAFFDEAEQARVAIKRSTDNKASKRTKENFFDEGSGILKDSIQALVSAYGDGNKTE